MHYIKTLYSFFWCASWSSGTIAARHGQVGIMVEAGRATLEKVADVAWRKWLRVRGIFGGCVGHKNRNLLEIWDRILEDIKHDFNLQKWEVVE